MTTTKTSYVLRAFADEGGWFRGDLERIAADCDDEDFSFRPEPGVWEPADCLTFEYVAFSRQPDGSYTGPVIMPGDIRAVAQGEGDGWFDDMLVQDVDEAIALMEERGTEPVEWAVCVTATIPGEIRFMLEPPRCEWREGVPDHG